MYTKLISLISAIVLASLVVVTASANPGNYKRYDSVPEKIAHYHINVNNIINAQTSALITYFDENEGITEDTQEVFLSPEQSQKEELCSREDNPNLSASCLFYKVNSEYQALRNSLGDVSFTIPSNLSEVRDLSAQSQGVEAEESFMIEELSNSRELMDQSVQFYRQLLFAYPIHKQYQKTIEQLEVYNSNLKQFRNQIEKYPNKFHNASTVECT